MFCKEKQVLSLMSEVIRTIINVEEKLFMQTWKAHINLVLLANNSYVYVILPKLWLLLPWPTMDQFADCKAEDFRRTYVDERYLGC